MASEHDGKIDLLLTDVVMPRMPGKELAERLVTIRPDVRVLYMSGYAMPTLGPSGTLEPGVNLLDKPFTEAGLLAKIHEIMDTTQPAR